MATRPHCSPITQRMTLACNANCQLSLNARRAWHCRALRGACRRCSVQRRMRFKKHRIPLSMTDTFLSAPQKSQQSWGAVLAMSLAAFALVASEFMPVSLLTPIATDLQISEGQAGQSISVYGLFALLTSLVIASVAARVDRKRLLLSLTLLMLVSGTLVAFAPNYTLF